MHHALNNTFLTHTLTHTRKYTEMSGQDEGVNHSEKHGHESVKSSQKRPAETPDAAHNPEVVGSNPSPATTKD